MFQASKCSHGSITNSLYCQDFNGKSQFMNSVTCFSWASQLNSSALQAPAEFKQESVS